MTLNCIDATKTLVNWKKDVGLYKLYICKEYCWSVDTYGLIFNKFSPCIGLKSIT